MCNPVMALMIAGTAVQGYSQYAAGQAEAKAMQYNADMQTYNAKKTVAEANDAHNQGITESQRLRADGQQLIGSQEAAFTAGNIDLGYGSPLDALLSTSRAIELDALTLRKNADKQRDDLKFQALNMRSGAALDKAGAANAKTSGMINMASTVLTGASSVYKYKASLSA